MNQNIKSILYSVFFSVLLLLFLWNPHLCTKLASEGLLSWFHTIIPSLFPFMVMTSIMHELQVDRRISELLNPLFYIFRHYSSAGKYCIVIGLLCGFPMGAKTVVEQYQDGKLSKKEAQILLPVCNQFSPAFMISVIYPAIRSLDSSYTIWKILLLMYCAPFLYCLANQHHISDENRHQHMIDEENSSQKSHVLKAMSPITGDTVKTDYIKVSIAKALDISLTKNILPIIKIGSYMIIFRVFSCMPELVFALLQKQSGKTALHPILQMLYLNCAMGLEITTGILSVSNQNILFSAIMLYFVWYRIHSGGLSCLMQTYAFIEDTDLSIMKYYRTKLLFGCITCSMVLLFSILHFIVTLI